MEFKKRIREFTEEEIIDLLKLEKPCYITDISLITRYFAGGSEHRSIKIEYLMVVNDGSD